MASEIAPFPVVSYTAQEIFNSLPQFVQDNDATNGYHFYLWLVGICTSLDEQVNALSRDSIGAAGVYDSHFFGAPGWSQLLDINRCPTFALPWLGQLVGVKVDPSWTYAQAIDKISNRAGFQRGTKAVLRSALATIINLRLPLGSTPITPSRILVMERTAYSGSAFVYDQYAAVILIPASYVSAYTYASLTTFVETWQSAHTYAINDVVLYNGITYQALVSNTNVIPAGNPGTWGVVSSSTLPNYAEANAIVQNYAALASATSPTTTSAYSKLIAQYRPAGVKVFIGGY